MKKTNWKYINSFKKQKLQIITILSITLLMIFPCILPQENKIDVHVEVIENHAPYVSQLIYPSNGQVEVSLNPTLTIRVFDPDNDTIDVYFYNAFNDNLIGYQTNISSGDETSITWPNLAYDSSYSWYVIVNDSLLTNKSDI